MSEETEQDARALELAVIRAKCEESQSFFTRYFFKHRQGVKFLLNWHHIYLGEIIEDVIAGRRKNVVINISPGGSKTEIVSINFMARGLALNHWARFLHISYSDDLASTNSHQARELVESAEFQELWPLKIAVDSKAKKKWNVMEGEKIAGGVYAVALGGQITGFRAGRMVEGFQGAIIIDDPLKPEDAFSKEKRNVANRRLVSTVKSRKANPETPIVVIMQRLAEGDPTGFIEEGNLGGKESWDFIKIPAIIDDEYVKQLPEHIQKLVDSSDRDKDGRFSYWPYKEPIKDLCEMEQGGKVNKEGDRISKHVFAGQYGQAPKALGGNIIQGKFFGRYKTLPAPILPKLIWRGIFADTASKTKERNDFSVFQCWGLGIDGKIYLLDQIRGKWEAPELKRRALAFWAKHKTWDTDKYGALRKMYVEDKSSGIGLVQDIKTTGQFPIEGVERTIDKLTRVMNIQDYIEMGSVVVPEDAEYTNDFINECEGFTSDDSHDYDDQIDPMVDAITKMLSNQNKLKQWENL